jgi:hypothetical protein
MSGLLKEPNNLVVLHKDANRRITRTAFLRGLIP